MSSDVVRLAGRLASLPSDTFIRVMRLTIPSTHWIRSGLAVVRTGTANFYLYRSGDAVAAFDSGYGTRTVRRELAALSINPEQITHVFLSHSDFDHVGGSRLFTRARLFISESEAPLFTGQVPRALGVRNRLPRQDPILLKDGAEIQVGSSTVRAVLTPGHTPGSTSFLVDGELLFTGDTLAVKHGEVFPPRRLFTMDV